MWRTDGRIDWTAARQVALNNTAKCQRTPHACSKFIVTKAAGGVAVENGKSKNEKNNTRCMTQLDAAKLMEE